jgi:LysM repeat protein
LTTKDKFHKASIVERDQNGNEINPPIEVLFNPEQYSIEKSNQFASLAVPGRDIPIIQFVRGESETLTLDIFFDTYTYHNSEDVTTYTDKISKLLKINGDIHAPPVCSFHWGSLSFIGIIEKLTKRFTMFKEDGTPVRATLSLTFKQYTTEEEPKLSSDKTKRHTVIEGDSLWLIAATEYGDPSKWKEIAQANVNIDNPRILEPGTSIIVPSLH